MKQLLMQILEFQNATGLSDHRVGFLLARNGRLIERMKCDGRVWPETVDLIRSNLKFEEERRAVGAEQHE